MNEDEGGGRFGFSALHVGSARVIMSTFIESSQLLDIARKAALTVGEPLRTAFRTPMDYEYKRDLHDIVTIHDRASEERIRSIIFSEIPDSTFVGEEGGKEGDGAVVWYVDPIDGTSNFASGIAHWCVSIAAAVEGELVAGVIFDPIARNLFSADLGGARLNDVPIMCRARVDEGKAVLLTGFPNARHVRDVGDRAFGAQAELLDSCHAVRNLGSGALHLAHLAAGWADATMGLSTNPWDVAAGILILRQAGGRFVGLENGRMLEPAFLAPDYFAHGREAAYPILERVIYALSAREAAPEQREIAG